MSTATATLSITGEVDGFAISDSSSMTATADKVIQFTRDIIASDAAIFEQEFLMAMVKNIGDEVICLRVGELNFAIAPGMVSVFSGAVGIITVVNGDELIERAQVIRAQALSGTARARFTIII